MNTLFGDEVSTTKVSEKSNEWFTPSKYIEAARKVMGSIDLDPASCAFANQTVKATNFYSEESNGLAHDWHGNVWLNPPFGRIHNGGRKGGQALFAHCLVRQYKKGNVAQAVLLVASSTEVTWFDPLWDFPICFVRKRLDYYSPTPDDFTRSHQSRFGTCFVYLGNNEAKFIEVFSQFGRIVKAIDIPKSSDATQASLWTEEVSA